MANELAPEWETVEKVMLSQRAVRDISDEPVDDATIERLIRAATFAPSANNTQPWRFLVIRDHETKRKLGVIFDELGKELYGDKAPAHTPWEDIPVLIAACTARGAANDGASIYPVVQNLLLAVQAAGLGSVLTTRWKNRAGEINPILGLPEDVEAHAILPVGWPTRRPGRGRRQPVSEIAYREKYGQPW